MAAKAYPALVSVTDWESSAPAEEHTIFASPASLNPGYMYVVTCSWISALGNTPAVTVGCNWTREGYSKFAGAVFFTHHAVFSMHATGSVDEWLIIDFGETITLNCAIWQFSGVERGTTAIETSHQGASGTNPDLGTIAPTSGSDMYLWLASVSRYSADTAGTAPTGYSTIHTNNHSVTTLHGAYKTSTASSENPDAFTDMVSAEWCGAMIAIRNWGEYVGGQTITHPQPVSVPTLTTGDYGIKTWASDGTLTMDTDYTQLMFVYSKSLADDEDDHVHLPVIDGKEILIWKTLSDYAWGVKTNTHTIVRDGTTITWTHAASAPGTTTLLVFIYE